ncbi:MAG TPA: 4Fe-4S single cluster domain-containing protein [Pyrinomonadaceae bacterium]|jgi:anaerobic ribonucleoside-triphosphate reductase activating protein
MAEIVFVIEPNCGRVTIESSQVTEEIAREIKQDLGQGNQVNCARPAEFFTRKSDEKRGAPGNKNQNSDSNTASDGIHLFRLYHNSTVDGPGRRSVVQFAGCSIRCAGCYVPETHERANGKLTPIDSIVAEIDEKSGEHDGVTVIGGEPFDQPEALASLVIKLKTRNYHLTVYTGYILEQLTARAAATGEESVNLILSDIDLLIDGAFDRNLTRNAGEYRGSSNQRLIHQPFSGRQMTNANQKSLAGKGWKEGLQTKVDLFEFIADCLDEGFCPTECPEGCVVEPDGVCPHDFKSVAVEHGLI